MSFDCSSLSIIKAQVLIFLQLKDTSRILRFSSVSTSFIVTTFWGLEVWMRQKRMVPSCAAYHVCFRSLWMFPIMVDWLLYDSIYWR